MIKYSNFTRIIVNHIRKFASGKLQVVPDENVVQDLEKSLYKPRNHPGVLKPRVIQLPDAFIKAVENVIEDHPIKSLIEDGKVLNRHLKGKSPPVEKAEIRKNIRIINEKVLSKIKVPQMDTEESRLQFQQKVTDRVNNVVKKEVYNWKPVNYNSYNSLVYLIGRSAAEYAVLVKIFGEISERDSAFKPRSLFDFGSGVGTVTWAANMYWKKHIFEYFNVDSSVDMNDLAQILLQNGRGNKMENLRGVFYRQFLPASNTSYDLVVSAYSLLELPSRQARLETILNLWNKAEKYLVVVEQGTNAGFQVINEIRDFLIHMENNENVGHVFSPCPHDKVCPRYVLNDSTPCNFQIYYFTLPIGAITERKQELYSYVVLKKGKRDSDDSQWPRVVRQTLVRSKHTICRFCTKDGNLDEVIFTGAKHGKSMYHCARSTRWGDRLPIKLETIPVK